VPPRFALKVIATRMSSYPADLRAPLSHPRIWRMALPIMLSNLTVPLLGAVDTAVVGHLPEPRHLGAVAVGSTVFNLIYWSLLFLRSSTTGLVAQAIGAGNGDEVRAVLARSLLLALVLGLLLIAGQGVIAVVAFGLIDGSAEVEELARSYLFIRILAAPLALASFAMLGWFIGLQATGAVFVATTVMNVANMALDLLFVFGFGWGVEGVALATAIAEALGLITGLLLARPRLRRLGGQLSWPRIFEPTQLKRLFALNRDIFLRNVCVAFAFAFAFFTAQGAKQGDVVVAANAVLMNFFFFLAFGLDGFAHAAQALVGMTYGARRRDLVRLAVRRTSLWALVTASAYVVIYGLLSGPLIALLTSLEDVRALANAHAAWLIWMLLVAVLAMQLDGIFIGATRGSDMRNAMLVALAIYLVVSGPLQARFGNDGLWAAFTLFVLLRGLTQAVRYPALERSVAQDPQ